MVKNLPASAGDVRDTSLIPGLGRSLGGGHGNPLQYSCLENPMDRGAWRATVHSVAKSRTWLKLLSTHAQDICFQSNTSLRKSTWSVVNLERRVVVKALLFSYAFKTDVNQLLHISRDRQTNQFSSVHFSRSSVSNSLQPHGLQHVRLPCPSPTPGACSNSCPLNQWCHPTISSSVIPFSSRLPSFPA